LFKIQKRIIYAIEAVIDIALNSGDNPVQNISIAKRQGIPKRYLEQTLQTLVKNNILVASRGPNGGYRLAKERRKIMVSDIISSVSSSSSSDLKDFYNTQISKFLIEPLITKVTKKSFELLNNISVEDIYKLATTSKNQNLKKKKVDFVI
jgi:Rrf2 family protein